MNSINDGNMPTQYAAKLHSKVCLGGLLRTTDFASCKSLTKGVGKI